MHSCKITSGHYYNTKCTDTENYCSKILSSDSHVAQDSEFLDGLTIEDEGTMIFQNTRNHSPSDTSHSSRPESSVLSLS
jgi:hypothetical protein